MKCWRKPLSSDRQKSDRYEVRVIKDRCKGCRLCIEFCPRQALHESNEFNRKGYHFASPDSGLCLNCGLCQLVCPEFAIMVSSPEEEGALG